MYYWLTLQRWYLLLTNNSKGMCIADGHIKGDVNYWLTSQRWCLLLINNSKGMCITDWRFQGDVYHWLTTQGDVFIIGWQHKVVVYHWLRTHIILEISVLLEAFERALKDLQFESNRSFLAQVVKKLWLNEGLNFRRYVPTKWKTFGFQLFSEYL